MNAPNPVRITLVQLAQWAGGDLFVRDVPADATAREALLGTRVSGATLDTRAIAPGMLFVPLPGSRTDGHAFLDEAFERGAGAALCARAVHPRVQDLPLGTRRHRDRCRSHGREARTVPPQGASAHRMRPRATGD